MIFVIDFAVGGHAAMEGRAVPGRYADLVIAGFFLWLIPLAFDFVGLADLIATAALGNVLPIGNARARFHAVDRLGKVFLAVRFVFLHAPRRAARRQGC